MQAMLAHVSGSRPSSPRRLAWNVTALAAGVALVNLLWTRTSARLLLPHAAISTSANEWLLAVTGFFAQLGAVLALALIVLTLTNTRIRQMLFPPTMGVSLVFIGGLFVLLTARTLIGPVGGRPLMYLKVAYGFLNAFVLLGAWRGHFAAALARRQLLGISLIVLPPVAAALATFLEHSSQVPETVAVMLDRMAERTWLAAAALSPLLLAPHRLEGGRFRAYAAAGIAGVLAAAAAWGCLLRRFDLVQALAAHGLGLDVPAGAGQRGFLFALLLAAAAGGFVFTVVASFRVRRGFRLCGYGLVLVAAAGYAPASPALMAVSFVGALALSVGVFASAGPVDAAREQGSEQPERP